MSDSTGKIKSKSFAETRKNDSATKLLEKTAGASNAELFWNWMVDNQNLANRSARSYVSAITNCEQLANKLQLPETRLYGSDLETAQRIKKQLTQTAEYKEINARQHNRYSAAFEKYLLYLKTDARKVTTPMLAKDLQSLNTKLFEKVLEQRFAKGFRLGSPLDMKKFRRYYEELNGAPIDTEDGTIQEIIRGCGIVYGDKIFSPKTMLSDDIKEKLYTYIKKIFNSGKNSIYCDALFQKFSEDFLGQYIYNADMLRLYLAFECGDKYIIGKNQISRGDNINADPLEEVRVCLKSYGSPMKKSDLYKNLAHLSQSKIDEVLGSNPEFVYNGKSEYFHADTLGLSAEELESIAELIEKTIRSHEYISGAELINVLREKYSDIYEEYPNYSDVGWRDALKYKLGNRFSFKGNIISAAGKMLSMRDVFGQITTQVDEITLEELRAFSSEMGTTIYFDVVYQSMIRIDENTFVSKKRAGFQVKQTDRVLNRFCQGNYISMKEVYDFGVFPDANFPWTVYLLESYVAFYSERYSLLHGNYNQNCAVGAIVKKSAGYGSFDDLIVDVIADSGISLNRKDTLEFLVNSGYIARRSYKNIEGLMIRANAQRNKKRKT